MATSRLVISGNIAGMAVKATHARTEDGGDERNVAIAGAKTGTLSTRTNDTDGELTMEAGHGIETADKIDLYWVGGRRYNVTVGVVDVNDVPISEGTGDNLPAQSTAITAMLPQVINLDFDADEVSVIGVQMPARGSVSFVETATIEDQEDLIADELWQWDKFSGYTNPLAGHVVDEIRVSQAGTSAVNVRVGVLHDTSV